MKTNQLKEKLVKIDFNPTEADVYIQIARRSPITAAEIAETLHIPRESVYRLANLLEKKELISTISTRPKKFIPTPFQKGINNYLEKKLNQEKTAANGALLALLKLQSQTTAETHVEFIPNKEEIYNKSVELINSAKETIHLITIGETIPQELMLANKNATDRGVEFRMIVHKNDEENKTAIESLKKVGIKIRHYNDWGFHLLIIDSTALLMGINNPENTNERQSILFNNAAMTKAMQTYFFSIWSLAKPK